MKSRGTAIVTVSGAPTVALAPAPSRSSTLPGGNWRITGVGEANWDAQSGWHVSHERRSCYPPHWYSARLGAGGRWAWTLTLNGLFVAAVASCFWGTKRLSVRQKRLNGAPKRPGLTDRRTVSAGIPTFEWNEEPREGPQVRSGKPGNSERQPGRREWMGGCCPLSFAALWFTQL